MMAASEHEIQVAMVLEQAAADRDNIYVAISKEAKENELTLVWALQLLGDKKICLVSVLAPAKNIPMEGLGAKIPVSAVTEAAVKAYRESERKNMHRILDEYLAICNRMGVEAEKELIEADSIEKGLVEFISSRKVEKLVMGAAADKRYYKRMTELKSRKAIHVKDEAPSSCHIWFICNGHLIHTRKARAEESVLIPDTSLPLPSPDSRQLGLSKSLSSAMLRRNDTVKLINPFQDVLRRTFSSSGSNSDKQLRISPVPSLRESLFKQHPPPQQITVQGGKSNYAESLKSSARSPRSPWSLVSLHSSSVPSDFSADYLSRSSNVPSDFSSIVLSDTSTDNFNLSHTLDIVNLPVIDENVKDDRYDQLEQSLVQAENAIEEAFEGGERWANAENEIIKAAVAEMVKTLETLYMKKRKLRKEIKEEVGKTKDQWDELTEALRITLDQTSLFENQIAEKDQLIKELEQRMASETDLLQRCQQELDIAGRKAEELRSRLEDPLSVTLPVLFTEFPLSEIKEATRNFHPSYKIGAGGYGDVYKCLLRHVPVAIKKLRMNNMGGPQEFEQEVKVLSKVRHPNLVTLIGACPEECILVYEYLPKGSLEDQLNCRDNMAPLTWQFRVRIATELCSVLVFLHSSKPYMIVHGNLKPSNILLDDHLVSKLCDFGTCCLLSSDKHSSNNTKVLYKSEAKVTVAYTDPEFVSTGEITTMFDVYSFGIILLQLLTGRVAMGITKDVHYALSRGNLKALLDSSAGEWPHALAEELARLALKCCEFSRKNRPDLQLDVLGVLEHMRASCE